MSSGECQSSKSYGAKRKNMTRKKDDFRNQFLNGLNFFLSSCKKKKNQSTPLMTKLMIFWASIELWVEGEELERMKNTVEKIFWAHWALFGSLWATYLSKNLGNFKAST